MSAQSQKATAEQQLCGIWGGNIFLFNLTSIDILNFTYLLGFSGVFMWLTTAQRMNNDLGIFLDTDSWGRTSAFKYDVIISLLGFVLFFTWEHQTFSYNPNLSHLHPLHISHTLCSWTEISWYASMNLMGEKLSVASGLKWAQAPKQMCRSRGSIP